MWSVRQTFRPTTLPLRALASRFRCTLGNGWSGRPVHPLRGVGRARDKGQCLVFTFISLLCRCQWSASALQRGAGLCTFATVVRRPFGKGTARFQTRTQEAWIHRCLATQQSSMRLSALGGGVCGPLHRFLFTRDLAQQVSSLFPFLTSSMHV